MQKGYVLYIKGDGPRNKGQNSVNTPDTHMHRLIYTIGVMRYSNESFKQWFEQTDIRTSTYVYQEKMRNRLMAK